MIENEVLFDRSAQNEEDSDDNPWDDESLVRSYDAAVKRANTVAKKSIKETKTSDNWKVGDFCRCPFSEDGNIYEGIIIKLLRGKKQCRVKYVGYENEENVPLSKLGPSHGETSRLLQIKDAENDKDSEEDMEVGSQSSRVTDEEKVNPTVKKQTKIFTKKSNIRQNRTKFDLPSSSGHFIPTMITPPPPPPNVFVQDQDSEVISAMLMSWYMSGYHTGYYHGLKEAKKKQTKE